MTSYARVREEFRRAAVGAGARLRSIEIAARGPEGEALSIDIAWLGSERPRRVVVHSSGLHGVEGFAGSEIQQLCLRDGVFDAARLPADCAIVVMHALNPYGMAWLRRWNENNVDLNRNFLFPETPEPAASPIWGELDALLNPASGPGSDFFVARAAWLNLRHGRGKVKQAVAGGQRANARGLFYTGRQMEEGPAKVTAFLKEALREAEEVIAIDVHTGLGDFGEDKLLVQEACAAAARSAFGERVEVLGSGGVAYDVHGAQQDLYRYGLPKARTVFVTQEFGTYGTTRVAHALREENRLHFYGKGGVDHPVKRQLLEAFHPADRRWQERVLARGLAVARAAVDF